MSTPSASRSVTDAFLQQRVGLLFRVLFFQELFFSGVAIVLDGLGISKESEDPNTNLQIYLVRTGALVLTFVAWQLARYLPRRWLHRLDEVGVLLLSLSYFHLGLSLPLQGTAFATLLLAFLLALRAAVVPSQRGRTLAVSLLAAVPFGSLAIAVWLRGRAASGADLEGQVTLWLILMAGAFVVLAGVISQVIYGLRREVQAARRMGQYELRRLLGRGGMGVVYEATHVLLRRPTALKVLPIDKVGERAVARFEREVRQTSRLEHPNSVYVYDYGRTPDGHFYYAMEYLDGLTLGELVAEEGPLPEGRVLHILKQAAHALAEAHAIGLVHRDIKPANLMICDRGGVPDTVKVLDFGLVKELQEGGGGDGFQTQTQTIVGTPHYLAPEAIRDAEAVRAPADVYALGALAFFLLTGRTLFEAGTIVEICALHLREPPPSPSDVRGAPLDEAFEEVILRCLEKDPGDRFADATDLVGHLEGLGELRDWSPGAARRWWAAFRQRGPRPRVVESASEVQLTVDLVAR